MTTREMQIAFQRELSSINEDFETLNLLDSDTILYFLNISQHRYMKEKYISKTSIKENVEFLMKRVDDLKQLITRQKMFTAITSVSEPTTAISSSALPTTQITVLADGGILFPLPTNYFYYIRSTSKVTGTYASFTTASWIENKIVEHADISNSLLINGLNTPIIRQPLIILEYNPTTSAISNSCLILYKDSYTNLFNMEITYIRKPKNLVLTVSTSSSETTTCELPESTHQEIVTYGVNLFIEQYKYKLQAQTSNKGGAQ